jgi:hypothetical protein
LGGKRKSDEETKQDDGKLHARFGV